MNSSNESKIKIVNVPDFWDQMSTASSRFLGLDYDGTLAPFHVDPMQAKPLPGVLDLLRVLVKDKGTTVAIISGRPAAEVSTLLDNLPVIIVGSHGFELWHPSDDGPSVIQPLFEQKVGLEKAKVIALEKGYGEKLEYKVASTAMHTRGFAVEIASAMEESIFAAWTEIANTHNLECRRFNGGVEIRCAGRHKGDAVLELLRSQSHEVFSVYVGDDDTDEDAFRAIHDMGVGIKVGSISATTSAKGFLKDCDAVKRFLETWTSVTSTPGS